jgi:hypothetical protein
MNQMTLVEGNKTKLKTIADDNFTTSDWIAFMDFQVSTVAWTTLSGLQMQEEKLETFSRDLP